MHFDAEEILLFRMYSNPAARAAATRMVRPEFFVDALHRRIFIALSSFEDGGVLDLPTEAQERLMKITLNPDCTLFASHDAVIRKIIKDFKHRQTTSLLEFYKSKPEQAGELIEEMAAINSIDEEIAFTRIGKQTEDYMRDLEDVGVIYPTCWGKLNEITGGGIKKKRLWVIGGYTSHGKSAIGIQLFWEWIQQGRKCAYFSTEMSYEDIIGRLVSLNVGRQILPGAPLDPDTGLRVKAILTRIRGFSPYINDDLYSPADIEKEIVGIRAGQGLDVVIIDFIQNIDGGPGQEIYERMSHTIRWAQKLAKRHDVAVVVLSQLSNQGARELFDEVKRNENQIPLISYKGAGEIAAAVDLGAIIILRGDIINFYVAKQRQGPKTMFKLRFENDWTILKEYDFDSLRARYSESY